MNYLELSIEDVKKETKKLYDKVIKNYDYDLVIFIAKGSYLIGDELSKLNNTPLLEIFAVRKGNKIKQLLKPIIKFVPRSIRIKMREKEMNSDYHEQNNDRKVNFDAKEYLKYKNVKNILLVDDSIDSGNSIILTTKAIKGQFKKAKVKVAVFNTMSKSSVKADYTLYENMMICGPWSNDSKYYNKYAKMYKVWKEKK